MQDSPLAHRERRMGRRMMAGEAGSRESRAWWESRWLLLALIAGCAIPLLYPPIPPLVDLLGHMGRYRVELDLASSPWLQRYYGYRWAAIGNLGVDVLVKLLGPALGLELAVKLIVLAIPPLTAAGFLWVAREVHGRIPPTAFFALPLIYGHPFLFGFVNYSLAMALAFLVFGLWLRLGRLGRTRLRAVLFVPISVVIFFCHTYGWGALGLLCFSAEAVRQHDKGIGWWKAGLKAALHASVMALPVAIMLAWRSETHGGSISGWFNWSMKLLWLTTVFRDRWQYFDLASLAVVPAVLIVALRHDKLTFSRNLAFSAIVLIVAFAVVPWTVFGSAYADMRLVPYMMAVLLLAIRFRDRIDFRLGSALAAAGLLFCVVRLGATALSLKIAADDQQAKLAALDHVPVGARLVSFVGTPCRGDWTMHRLDHLPALALVRREAFSNDQWSVPGAQMLQTRYAAAEPFARDPSQIVRLRDCPINRWRRLDESLRLFPRGAFDYLWLINPPAYDSRLTASLQPVWRGGASILFRIPHPERTR
jgi:hypothetical protein